MSTEALTVESVYTKVRKVVYSRIRHAHDREDVLQEALLIVWKAIDEGETDVAILCGKARNYCRQFLSKRGRTFTGSTTAGSKPGREETRAAVAREKMRAYITEFRALHGRKPNNSEISRGLGMPLTSVRQHMDRLYMFAGALTKEDVSLVSSDIDLGDGQSSDRLNIVDLYHQSPSFEEDTILELTVTTAMDRVLSDRERTVVELHVFADIPLSEMEFTHGLPSKHMLKRNWQSAVKKLRVELEELVA